MTHDFSACLKLRKIIMSHAGQVATSLLEKMLHNDTAIPDASTVVGMKRWLRVQDSSYWLKQWEWEVKTEHTQDAGPLSVHFLCRL